MRTSGRAQGCIGRASRTPARPHTCAHRHASTIARHRIRARPIPIRMTPRRTRCRLPVHHTLRHAAQRCTRYARARDSRLGTRLRRRPHSVDPLDDVVAVRADARGKRRHVLACAAARTQKDCDIAGRSRRCSEQATGEWGSARAGEKEAGDGTRLLEPHNDTAQRALWTATSHTSGVTIRHGRPRALMRLHAHIRPCARLYRTRRTNARPPAHMRV